MPIHQHIVAHIDKHRKKYVFGIWVAVGIAALRVITITGIFLGIHTIVGKSQGLDQERQIYQQLVVFDRLDDFMHRKFNEITKIPDLKREVNDKWFLVLDAAYHNAKNLNEKYQAAKNIIGFAIQWQEILKNLGYATPEDIKDFDQIVYQFYQIK